jgi:hypothetical protein
VSHAARRSPSSSSGSLSDAQESKNADALRIHVFIAVAMAVGGTALLLCFLRGYQAYTFDAVIICKLFVVKVRGDNIAFVRAAEMMFLSSLFTVQVRNSLTLNRSHILIITHRSAWMPPKPGLALS